MVPRVSEDSAGCSTNRLARLEARVGRQARCLTGLVVLGAAALILGAAPGVFDEIKSRRFVVSDEDDNPRALLTSHKGTTLLSLFDGSGRARARISVAADGHPEINLLDQFGSPLLRLAEREGAVLLSLEDGRDQSRVVLGQNDQQFGINVSSGHSDAAVRVRCSAELPQLAVTGQTGSSLVQVFAHPDKSGISIARPEGSPAAVMSLLENERPLVLLQGRTDRALMAPTERETGSAETLGGRTGYRQLPGSVQPQAAR